MEDDLKEIFVDFEPDLADDFKFMQRLRANLDAVELVRRHAEVRRSRTRRAFLAAILVAFICGFLFALFLPTLTNALTAILLAIVPASQLSTSPLHITLTFPFPLACLLLSALAIHFSLLAYHFIISVHSDQG